jgi:hypothetical protein
MAQIIAVDGGNYHTLRKNVKKQFLVNRSLTDPSVIERCREDAIRGISNYLIFRATMIAQQQKQQQQQQQQQQAATGDAPQRNIFEEVKRQKANK